MLHGRQRSGYPAFLSARKVTGASVARYHDSMNETKRLRHLLKLSYHGKAWHGPSLRELLEGVNAETAAARPIEDAHSIWQLVRHIAAWETEAARVLEGKQYVTLQGDADWPPVDDKTDAAWTGALGELQVAQKALVDACTKLTDEQLDQMVPGTEFSFYFLLHGVIQHNLYHAGQIALLKKAAA
jgi:uncharacterized damage-inducible protein DinB